MCLFSSYASFRHQPTNILLLRQNRLTEPVGNFNFHIYKLHSTEICSNRPSINLFFLDHFVIFSRFKLITFSIVEYNCAEYDSNVLSEKKSSKTGEIISYIINIKKKKRGSRTEPCGTPAFFASEEILNWPIKHFECCPVGSF